MKGIKKVHRTYEIPPFEDASLTAICEDVTDAIRQKQPRRRAVIVCPGGAYSGLAAHEGDPVAFRFLAAGFATFVLRYSLKERAADFRPLRELALAIRFVREHAEELHVDPDYIFTLGFSTGDTLRALRAFCGISPRCNSTCRAQPPKFVAPRI